MVQESEKESIGAYLRREREERNISLEEISATTKINPTLLSFLEEDKFENLPNPIFVKGYLKAYAAHIGIDPKGIIGRFNERIHPQEKKSIRLAPTPKTFPKKIYWLFLGLITIGIALLTSTIGNKNQNTFEPTSAKQTETLANEIQPDIIATNIESNTIKDEQLMPQIVSNSTQNLKIQTTKPVWLKIQIDSHPTYSQHLVSNKEIQLKGEKEIKIYISDRSAVMLTHNGNLMDYSGNEPLPLFLELNRN